MNVNNALVFLTCIIALTLSLQVRSEELKNYDSPLIRVKTFKTMAQALEDLNQAIINNNYNFIRSQNIDAGLTEATSENKRVVLVYFCNFNMLNRALNLNAQVGIFVPCKITLIQKENYIEMVAINPRFLSSQIDDDRLTRICDQLAADYSSILEEATI